MKGTRLLRLGVGLQVLGLLFEAVSLFHLTPATFIFFLVIGAPLILLGSGLYLVHVFRELVRKEAL